MMDPSNGLITAVCAALGIDAKEHHVHGVVVDAGIGAAPKITIECYDTSGRTVEAMQELARTTPFVTVNIARIEASIKERHITDGSR